MEISLSGNYKTKSVFINKCQINHAPLRRHVNPNYNVTITVPITEIGSAVEATHNNKK